jgi:hypothetical protein
LPKLRAQGIHGFERVILDTAATDGPVLVLHDTTEFSYKRESADAIGITKSINSGRDKTGRLRAHTVCGILMHSSLAVTTEGLPLGLTAIKFWTRKKFKGTDAPKKEDQSNPCPYREEGKRPVAAKRPAIQGTTSPHISHYLSMVGQAAIRSGCFFAGEQTEARAFAAAARRTAASPQMSAAEQADAIAILMRRTLVLTICEPICVRWLACCGSARPPQDGE